MDPWPYNEEQSILNQYADDLERIIKNNDFDELTNYYNTISIGFKDKGIDVNDVHILFLICFWFCAQYNNIKAFKYLYSIFKQEDLYDYIENVDIQFITDTLYNLIMYKQYEMFRYLEPILINASNKISSYSFINELLSLSIWFKNYEMFEYAVNNYELDKERLVIYLSALKCDDEIKRFCQILSLVDIDIDMKEIERLKRLSMIDLENIEIE